MSTIKLGEGVVCWTCTFNKLTEQRIRMGKANEALTFWLNDDSTDGTAANDHQEDNPDHIMFRFKSFPHERALRKRLEGSE